MIPIRFKEQDGVSPVERMIQKSLYWPDGTRKKYSRSQASQNVDKRRRQMVQVLLDKYNDDHDLVEVCLSSHPHSFSDCVDL